MSDDVGDQVRAMLAGMRKPRRRGRARQAHVLADCEQIMVDGIACWRLGEGPAVLLIHGWEDDHSVWGPLIEELQRFGRSIVTCDMPGHGFSDEGEGLMSGFYDSAVKVANAMGPIDAIVGHSLGCAATVTATAAGLLSPERMVLISAAARHKVQLEYAIENWMEPDVGAYMRAHYDELFADDRNVFDLHALAPTMRAKALMVHSMDDPQALYGEVVKLVDLWPGAELVLTDGMGHRNLTQDPSIVQRIAEFLL